MGELSPGLQRLVAAGRLAHKPTDDDRARVFSMVQTHVAAAGIGAAAAAESGVRVLTTKVLGIVAAALTIGVGGGLLVHSLSNDPAANLTPTSANTWQTPIAAVEEALPTNRPTLPPEMRAVSAETKTAPGASRGSARPRDSLSEEVAILSRAQAELHGGRSESALVILAEHERKFRRGILAQERTAAKIQALCALGRVSEANALLGRLSPQSLSGESARQACSSSKSFAPAR